MLARRFRNATTKEVALVAARWLALGALVLVAGGVAAAQRAPAATTPYRVSVIVSDVGAMAERGRLERRVAEAWAARQRGLGGIFGRTVEVDVRSDGGSLEGAERLARIAVDLGAHAVICCSTPAASARVAPVAGAAGVVLLSPSGEPDPAGGGWQFPLSPGEATALQAIVRDAYTRDLTALGLMTLEGSFGDTVRTRLESFLGAPGLRIVGEARYPPVATILTPEALRVATRVPDAIVVWGLREDTALAVAGLRARGWEGPVYIRPSLLSPLAGGALPGLLGDVRVPVSPASLPDAIAADDERSSWLFDAMTLGDGLLESRPLEADGATMHDALTLLARAFEQVATYGIDQGELRTLRIATRDALVGLAPARLAAGTYDLAMDERSAALAEGMVIARFDAGRLRPLR